MLCNELLNIIKDMEMKWMKQIRIVSVMACLIMIFIMAGPGAVNVYAKTLLGSWDLTGSGVLQKVWLDYSRVEVEQMDGSYRTYNISGGTIQNYAPADTDGVAGDELIFATSYNITIICDKTNTVKTYDIPSSMRAYCGAVDTDGFSGKELVFGVGQDVKIICDRTGAIRTHSVTYSGSRIYHGAADTDGIAGAELIFSTNTNECALYKYSPDLGDG